MKYYSKFAVLATVAMLASTTQATLIGSLHLEDGQDITAGVDTFSGLNTRTSNGNTDTRGTVQGKVNFLAGASIGTGGYAGAKFPIYSFVTQYNDMNRYGGSGPGGGLVTFDYDLSGVVNEGVFKLVLDFTNRTTAHDSQFYISYNNGSSLTLDTTDVSTNAAHGASAIVSDTSLYTQIANLTAASGTMEVDLTSIITTAQSNGGLVRLAYVENNYLGDIRLQNESGIVTTIPEPATLGLISMFGAGVLIVRRTFML